HHPPVSPPSARDSQDRHSFPTRRSSDLKRDRSRGTPTRPTRPQGQTSNTSARINQATTTPSPRHQRHQPGDRMSAPALKPPFSYYGGKTTLAPQIAKLLPAHDHYVEPFAGLVAVLLAKEPSPMETVNDLEGDLMIFWRVLRDNREELAYVSEHTPHSRE